MTDKQLKDLIKLIEQGKADNFYSWAAWRAKRDEVMDADNRECQMCKAQGKYTRGEVVHHVKHLKDRPDLALSMWDGEERQLITVCKACHEELHPERMRKYYRKPEQITAERWD